MTSSRLIEVKDGFWIDPATIVAIQKEHRPPHNLPWRVVVHYGIDCIYSEFPTERTAQDFINWLIEEKGK